MNILLTLAAFALALGILIVVHELGHYAVARACGVKVLRFSVGFGKSLVSRRIGADRTEWSIAAFPLGGYVKMLDEREGDVAASEAHRAFNRQSVYKRGAIVLAGPFSNLLLAVFLYWVLFMHGIPGMKPVLGPVKSGTPVAYAGFREGDELLEVEHQVVKTWDDARWILIQQAVKKAEIDVSARDQGGHSITHRLDLSHVDIDSKDFLADMGFDRVHPDIPSIIGEVVQGGPASRIGLHAGDRIVALDGKTVKTWSEAASFIRNNGAKPIRMNVDRNGVTLNFEVTPELSTEHGESIGRVGIAAKIDQDAMDKLFTEVRYSPGTAFIRAFDKTWETSSFTLKMLGEMLLGQISMKNIGGPITIADYAGQSAKIGPVAYLSFLALISISLGVLNLLPVPVLDGGHLMYYMAEIVRGRPLPDKAFEIGQQVGTFLLFSLMALAIYNDLHRLITG
ncbi:MAG: RIP metalloprotease RseP [Burkholderiales bacterium]|nr:RIP metalloprotease RseP [Burkholderiales bacterium]